MRKYIVHALIVFLCQKLVFNVTRVLYLSRERN